MKHSGPPSPWTAVATQVRGLLARLEQPHAALQHIVDEPLRHIAALSPGSTVLDATPFGTLPAPALQPAAGPDEPAARVAPRFAALERRRAAPARSPAAATPIEWEKVQELRPGSAAPPPARTPPVLRVPGRTPRTDPRVRAGAAAATADAGADTTAGATADAGATAGTGVGAQRRDAELPASATQPAPVPLASLGSLVERVRRQLEAAAAGGTRAADTLTTSRTPAGPGEAGSAADASVRKPKSVLHLRPVTPAGGRKGAALQGTARTTTDAAPVALPPANSATPNQGPAPARTTAAAPTFFFNPLAEDRPESADDDALADRIAEVLREQARRQGIDPT